jgi:hypothetical protein
VSIAETITAAASRRAAARSYPERTSHLPGVQPGQLWLIETSPGSVLSGPAREAVNSANVVVYDRTLAGALSDTLPLGTYAEAAMEGAHDASLLRCVQFARDGWSVVRILAAPATQRDRVASIRSLAEQISGDQPAADIAVTVIGELPDGICEPTRSKLDRLDLIVVTYPQDAHLTVVVDGVSSAGGARHQPVAGNGLAG